ncbi:UNVERIFIED_CONTAM: hypothetical protein K2H54_057653 [Gekko kuhli]
MDEEGEQAQLTLLGMALLVGQRWQLQTFGGMHLPSADGVWAVDANSVNAEGGKPIQTNKSCTAIFYNEQIKVTIELFVLDLDEGDTDGRNSVSLEVEKLQTAFLKTACRKTGTDLLKHAPREDWQCRTGIDHHLASTTFNDDRSFDLGTSVQTLVYVQVIGVVFQYAFCIVEVPPLMEKLRRWKTRQGV